MGNWEIPLALLRNQNCSAVFLSSREVKTHDLFAFRSPGLKLLAPLSLPKGLQGKGDIELVRWGNRFLRAGLRLLCPVRARGH